MRGGKCFECFFFLNESSDCCSCGVGLSLVRELCDEES